MARNNESNLKGLVKKTLITSIIGLFLTNIVGIILWNSQFNKENEYNFNFRMIEVSYDVADAFSEYKISSVYNLEVDVIRQHMREEEGEAIDYREHFEREGRIKEFNNFGYEKSKNMQYYYSRLIRKLEIAKLFYNDQEITKSIDNFIDFIEVANFNVYIDEYGKERIRRGYSVEDVYPNYPELDPVNYVIGDFMAFVDFYLEDRFQEVYAKITNEIDLEELHN